MLKTFFLRYFLQFFVSIVFFGCKKGTQNHNPLELRSAAMKDSFKKFVEKRMAKLGLSEQDVILSCGYQNMNGGRKALRSTLAGSNQYPLILKNLYKVLQLSETELQDSYNRQQAEIAELKEIQKHEELIEKIERYAERIKNFRPYLEILTELKNPPVGSIVIYAICGGDHSKRLYLPEDFRTWQTKKQNQYTSKLIKNHYKEMKGKFMFMGSILGYKLQRTFTKITYFTITGELTDPLEDSNNTETEFYISLGANRYTLSND